MEVGGWNERSLALSLLDVGSGDGSGTGQWMKHIC